MGRVRNAYADLARAQKGRGRGAPAYSVFVNRKAGRALAAMAYTWGWTPNQVSVVSAAHTYVAIAVIAAAPITWGTGIAVAVLLMLGYAWDSADGQVARLRGGGTLAGEWLDHFLDAIKISTLHLAVLVALATRSPFAGTAWLLIPIAYSVTATVTFFGMLLNDLLKGKKGAPPSSVSRGWSIGRSIVMLPTDYGLLCAIFLLWGEVSFFFPVYSFLAACALGFLGLAAVKWFRDMTALDADAQSGE